MIDSNNNSGTPNHDLVGKTTGTNMNHDHSKCIRVIPYGIGCSCILLPGEKVCPGHSSPAMEERCENGCEDCRNPHEACGCSCHQKCDCSPAGFRPMCKKHQVFWEKPATPAPSDWEEEFEERFCGENRRLWMENTALKALTDIEIPLKEFIRQTLSSQREEIARKVEGLWARNKSAKCGHRTPKDLTANDYDCSDIHTGYSEAMSDILALIREGK